MTLKTGVMAEENSVFEESSFKNTMFPNFEVLYNKNTQNVMLNVV